ncbi:IS200/IS605 family element RNA-guided endonuclease TnpB [Methanococcoides burtonii]|uniref:Transposase n=1 Tax=Methanococcoides burtonii (strain DSM 6242 / NBRC 107633 / OCM 468 / ACE-M) TaxID=259564 RepID=Q12VH6_METBU|nr:IS200/IS605 family element RNA-guided endonuclease TnpB [Methanococcoides burtonii]ABE52550.1 transposase [Methanococcoides burtonii DSM 6242]
MLKAYKYRLYPSESQSEILMKHIGACRFTYNWALEQKNKAYEVNKEHLSRFELQHRLVHDLKPNNEWLKEVNSQSLLNTLINLESAFTRFFREKKGFPNFKSRKNSVQSFQIPQHYSVDFETNTIKLPKLKQPIKAKLHRKFEGTLKTATVSRTSTGKYYLIILIDDGKELPVKQFFEDRTTLGIDVGLTNFAILSNGEKINNPKHLRNSMDRMKILQKRMSKKQSGSKNRNKSRHNVAKLHEKIRNQRNDFLHKTTSKLISENQAIAVESLNVSGMLKNHCLAQAISDVSWSEFFRQLEYKADWYRKTLLKIGQFEPSSKLCNVCGFHNNKMTLKDRDWCCPECNTEHDRDINAAINVKKFALQNQNLLNI